MQVELAFGKTGLPLDLPAGPEYRILEARGAQPLADADAALAAALDNPIGCPPLSALAKGKKSAAISVCDITRPAPNRRTLPHVLRRLEEGGIPREGIRILIATGLHRGATDAEIREIVGPEIAASYTVLNHDARAFAEHRALGSTKSGIPIYIDERFVSADLRITLGFIEPHLMLGFSGGRKLVAPGLAAQETIKVIHSPKYMRNARSVEGSIENNPLHHELVEIAGIARHDFMLDVALARDRQIAGVFAGEPVAAHRAGVQFVSNTLLELLDEPVDAVITTAAGYPLDLTFYQTVKGITAAQHILKPGGRILVFGACSEGPGAPEFQDMLKGFRSYSGFLDSLRDREVIVDQWQMEKLALVGEKFDVLFYTPGLPQEFRGGFGANMFASADEAVADLVRRCGPEAKIAVVPEGPYVLAKLREPELVA
ncbi:MAG: nickel-dependent lactate racemase [Acidobacteria bacterium]|nr:nickel-dependent lactate racemase [Acidobacteriota bacterium]